MNKLPEYEEEYENESLDRMLNSKVIENSDEGPGQFLSTIFTVPKSNGGRRFILNLKKLNQFIEVQHFKMEDIRTAVHLVSEDCYLAVLDQKDADHMVPIHPGFRKYFKFRWGHKLYQYTCLPFGYSLAPWLYTKILKPVLPKLRSKLLVIVSYLDDLLIIGKTYDDCSRAAGEAVKLFTKLGFLINYTKSELEPAKRRKFLGFYIDTEKMRIELPNAKRYHIESKCKLVLNMNTVSLQLLAELIGLLVSACPAVEYGLLFTRQLEFEKTLALKTSNGSYKGKLKISSEGLKDIHWWIGKI